MVITDICSGQLVFYSIRLSNIATNKNVLSSPVQIRQKLISKQMMMEKSEKAKKLREQRKFGKKVGVCSLLLL